MFRVAGTTLATQEVESSLHNEKASLVREVTATEMTARSANIMTDMYTLLQLLPSLVGLIDYHNTLNFLLSLYRRAGISASWFLR